MPLELLMQEAAGMSDETLMEVVHFMQFLKTAPTRSAVYQVSPVGNKGNTIYRSPGLYKDQIRIVDGFDDPLDDFEEYM